MARIRSRTVRIQRVCSRSLRTGNFSVVLNNPDLPRFASTTVAGGTAAENKAALANANALYGTYTVDSDGDFASEHVEGSTFPNWNGLNRQRGQLTLTVAGDKMVEHLRDPGVPLAIVVWQRVR